MVATQNIDILGPIGTFALRDVLIFLPAVQTLMAACYSARTVHLHCCTSCTLTTLHCIKVSFLQCCPMKRYNKIFSRNVRGVLTFVRYCMPFSSNGLIYGITNNILVIYYHTMCDCEKHLLFF